MRESSPVNGSLPADGPPPVLALRGLSLEFPAYGGPVPALSDVCLEVAPGEIVALVGESGSGKSVAALASIRLLPPRSFQITGGSISLVGRDVLQMPERLMASLRGKQVSMVFQEPMAALNPTLRIGPQLMQVLRRHEALGHSAAERRALELLGDMHIADPARVMRGYAFELSGGMRQRVLIAMAFGCNPQLLIADEPTTALDVTVQAQVLGLIRERARAQGTAVLFISHDLALVSQLCTRVYVMYAGRIVERGDTRSVLATPRHPYTRALLRSLPDAVPPGTPLRCIAGTVPNPADHLPGCRFAPRCDLLHDRCREQPALESQSLEMHAAACWVAGSPSPDLPELTAGHSAVRAPANGEPLVRLQGASVRYTQGVNWRGKPVRTVQALDGIDLDIRRGETLAVVGESGCGKTTLAQVVMGLVAPSAGAMCFDGVDLARLQGDELRRTRRRFQMVFQDPQGSLDPRMPAWALIAEPLQVAGGATPPLLRRRAAELADRVGIRADMLDRHAHEFSGGQRQRLAIARALALEPDLLVLDEPTSALDVSIQAQILNLLTELQAQLGLTYLFISHNVAVVEHMADRVAVMYLGRVVELGPAAAVIASPQHPYTRQLIDAVPRLYRPLPNPANSRLDAPVNLRLPTGCSFVARCGLATVGCETQQVLRPVADGRSVRCHRSGQGVHRS